MVSSLLLSISKAWKYFFLKTCSQTETCVSILNQISIVIRTYYLEIHWEVKKTKQKKMKNENMGSETVYSIIKTDCLTYIQTKIFFRNFKNNRNNEEIFSIYLFCFGSRTIVSWILLKKIL